MPDDATLQTYGARIGTVRLDQHKLGVEWVEDDFLKTRNQDQIGKTEDHPLGRQAHVRVGVATPGFGSNRDAVIFDTRVSKGFHTCLRGPCCWPRQAAAG